MLLILSSLVLMMPVQTVIFWMIWSRWREKVTIRDMRQADYSFKTLARRNLGFSYKPVTISSQKFTFLLGLPMIAMGLWAIIAARFESTWGIISLMVTFGFFILYCYDEINVSAKNRRRETLGISSYFNCDKITELCSNAYSDHPTCLYVKYIIRQTDEYGNFERLIAAYLSNGKTIVFKVASCKDERDKWSLTIRMNPEETNDKEIINKLLPLRERIVRDLHPDNNVATVLIIYLLGWLVLATILIAPFFLYKFLWVAILLCYTLICYFLAFTGGAQQYPQWFIKVYTFPGKIYNILFNLTAPIILFLIGIVIILVFAAMFAALIYGASWLFTDGEIGFNINYVLFLVVVSFSMTSVYANGTIQRIFESLDLFRNVTDKSMESPMLGMVEYVFQKENINCVIYMSYLIYISLSSFGLYLSDNHEYLINEDIDTAIIKAFLIHIAFSNMMARKKELKFNTKGFMEYIIKILEQK